MPLRKNLPIPIPALIGQKTWREERTTNINDAIKALVVAINAERDKQNNALVMETAERLKERKMREVVNGETFTDPSDELNQVEKSRNGVSSSVVIVKSVRFPSRYSEMLTTK